MLSEEKILENWETFLGYVARTGQAPAWARGRTRRRTPDKEGSARHVVIVKAGRAVRA